MTQNKNYLTSLPFYKDLSLQDNNKWWVDTQHRLISPNNKFLPFQIIKDVTLVGGVSCPVPTSVDYTADFTANVDGWQITDIVGNINAVLSWDNVGQRVKIDVTSNVGNTFFGVVVKRINTGQNYQFNAGSVEAVIRGTNAADQLGAYGIPGSQNNYPSGTILISSGYTLIDSNNLDSSFNDYSLFFYNENASSTTFYIESFEATSTPYLKLDLATIYQSDFSASIDSWIIAGGGAAALSFAANDLVLTYNTETFATLERTTPFTTSSSIKRFKISIIGDQGIMYSLVLYGSTFSRVYNVNHNFASESEFILEVDNSDNWENFTKIRLLMQPNGNATTNLSNVTFTVLEECIDSSAELWTLAEIVNAQDGTTTDITTYMNANTGISTYDNYQIAIYDASVNLPANMINGYYYLRLNDGTTDFYSEVFTPCGELEGFLKIEWWRDVDMEFDNGRVVFQGGYINTAYLDTDIGRPNTIYEIEETERDGFKFVEKTVTYHRYRFEIIVPEYMTYVLSRLPNHEHIVVYYNNEQFQVQKIEVLEPEWEDNGDLALLLIEFETNTIITSGTRISGTVNELFANETEAINIRGNNKRIYQLSDIEDFTNLYLAVDKDGFTEAGRLALDFLNSLGGAIAVEDKAARNAIPQASRAKHILVSYDVDVEKYTSSDLSDLAWTNDDNWVSISTPPTLPAETILNGAVNTYIVVGDITVHNSVRIEYTATRGVIVEVGEITLTNLADTQIKRSALGNTGLTIAKNIDSNDIRLDITDNLTDGNNTSIVLTIKRGLL